MSSQNIEQNAWYLGFQKIMHGISAGIKVAYLAKVVKYHKKSHTADILPLVRSSSGVTSAQYLDVPMVKSCYEVDELLDTIKSDFSKVDGSVVKSNFSAGLPKKHTMRNGVVVAVVVLDRDTDNFTGSAKTYAPNSSRMHNENDSIIVGVI